MDITHNRGHLCPIHIIGTIAYCRSNTPIPNGVEKLISENLPKLVHFWFILCVDMRFELSRKGRSIPQFPFSLFLLAVYHINREILRQNIEIFHYKLSALEGKEKE